MKKGVSALGLILGLFLFLALVGLIYELQGGLLRATKDSVRDAQKVIDPPVTPINMPHENNPSNNPTLPDSNPPPETGNPSIIPPSGNIDWNQEPKLDSLSGEKKINAQKIINLAKEEGVSPLLMVALAQQESSFLHSVDGKIRDSGFGGSKGILQVTAKTAYGQPAPAGYEGIGTECYNSMTCASDPCPCRGLDYCQIEGNIRCGIRIFKDKMDTMQSDTTYENSVRKICKNPEYLTHYLAYKGDIVRKTLRYYNGFGCVPPGADTDYVERILQRAKNFR
ncbi:MAG TPA: hypothetical protein VJG90_02185 [Candidatus Nanoarchaeia archaeon]|nr:hypothetical protein [Candidatus Nanoarchaeia archaeon]